MNDEVRIPFLLLGRVGDTAEARLLVARLASEGIEARVRSESEGPYVFNVGRMAEAEVWVDERYFDDAREIMLGVEINDTLARTDATAPDAAASSEWRWPLRLVAAIVVLAFVALIARRVLILLGT